MLNSNLGIFLVVIAVLAIIAIITVVLISRQEKKVELPATDSLRHKQHQHSHPSVKINKEYENCVSKKCKGKDRKAYMMCKDHCKLMVFKENGGEDRCDRSCEGLKGNSHKKCLHKCYSDRSV